MARLKAINLFEDKCEMVAAPTNFEFEIVGKKVSVASKHTDWYTLDMPLQAALEELNAAMNDDRPRTLLELIDAENKKPK
ncbi:MAG: hypothetical protein ACYSWR_06670 [Planctomycetota bacterium]